MTRRTALAGLVALFVAACSGSSPATTPTNPPASGSPGIRVSPSVSPAGPSALAGQSTVAFKTYPAMNHLLLDGSGTPSPAEYNVAGHADASLVADLAAWIKAVRG